MEDETDGVSALSGLTGTGRHSKQISQLMNEQIFVRALKTYVTGYGDLVGREVWEVFLGGDILGET